MATVSVSEEIRQFWDEDAAVYDRADGKPGRRAAEDHFQSASPNGFSCGTSIPAIATPMSTCAASTSYSVGRRRHAAARRLAH